MHFNVSKPLNSRLVCEEFAGVNQIGLPIKTTREQQKTKFCDKHHAYK